MSATYLTTAGYDTLDRRYSASPKEKHFHSSRHSPTRFDMLDDTSSDGRTSSDESDVRIQNIEKPVRKNSTITFSNVKRKISSTFNRRNSAINSPILGRKQQGPKRTSITSTESIITKSSPIIELSPFSKRRHSSLKLRRPSTAEQVHQRKSPIINHPVSPLFESLRRKSLNLFGSSSTPDIQSQSREKSTKAIKTFNLYLLGSKSVGKTALTVRFLTGRYIHEYTSSPDELYNRVIKYEDGQAQLRIHVNDIEDMEEDIELDHKSGIMILYSIVDRTSFLKAKLLLEHLHESSITGQYPIMFIGTKRDLRRLRKVENNEAFEVANGYNCTQFDVSAASDKKVKDCFHALLRQIEVRQLLHNHDDGNKHTILNPPRLIRNGIIRYGTA